MICSLEDIQHHACAANRVVVLREVGFEVLEARTSTAQPPILTYTPFNSTLKWHQEEQKEGMHLRHFAT
jgi:hypothetical protein